ncbi:hypothetical protein SKAU_G00394580 [Synaphobranchus kaupii]|uniref:Uncharacterized protein n=1 Tax=Synaphobranchus kaupii TaxID=118154 RepID=A0A9Q1EC79_SYNKA|nr:hypothetical protein SKAU_G00394580 [Synaphobranchus kaupii]
MLRETHAPSLHFSMRWRTARAQCKRRGAARSSRSPYTSGTARKKRALVILQASLRQEDVPLTSLFAQISLALALARAKALERPARLFHCGGR